MEHPLAAAGDGRPGDLDDGWGRSGHAQLATSAVQLSRMT